MEITTDCKCTAGKHYGQHMHADLPVCTVKHHANSCAPEDPKSRKKAANKLQHNSEAAH